MREASLSLHTLAVATRAAKNTDSRRILPIPPSLAPHLIALAIGRDLPIKSLRKSFATWTTRAGIDPAHREAYLGHRYAAGATITARHYLAAPDPTHLIPAALWIDTHSPFAPPPSSPQ